MGLAFRDGIYYTCPQVVSTSLYRSLLVEMVLSPLAVAVIAEQEEEAAPASAPLTAALLGTLDLVTSAQPAPGAQLLWLGDPGKVLTVLTELLTRPRWVQSV